MGDSAKALAPIAAIAGIAALGVATGGFGLFAAAPAAAAAAGAAGAGAAGAAGATAAATAAAGAAGVGAAGAGAAGAAASTGLLGSLGTWLSANAGALALGSAAVSGVTGVVGANAQAAEIEAQSKAAGRADALRLATEEAEIQRRFNQTIAAQNAFYGAAGIDAGTGSALNVRDAAAADAGREQLTIRANATGRQIMRFRERSRAGNLVPTAAIEGFGKYGSAVVRQAEKRRAA